MNCEKEFNEWLKNNYKSSTIQKTSSKIKAIDKVYDVEKNTTISSQIKLINSFIYTKKDEKYNKPNPTKISIDGNIYEGLSSYKQVLTQFYEFYNELIHQPAMFSGSKEDFENLFHPSLAKIVQDMTRPYKKDLNNVCECCGKSKQLESAHKEIKKYKGKERQGVVYSIIEKNYDFNNGAYTFDINNFLYKFMLWHNDVEKKFYFLCSDCHKKYDRGNLSKIEIDTIIKNHKENFE